jgi:hypothetical protein
MALTLGQGAQMVADVGYQTRVRSGMVRFARTVMAEAIGTMTPAEFNKRKILATRVLQTPDNWLTPFLAAVAADSAASLTWYTPTLITSSTNANPSVVTTSSVHGLAVGDVVEIVGSVGNTNIIGTWVTPTIGSTTTFTVPHPANAAGTAGGYVMKMETDVTVNFTIQSAWSGIAGTYTGEV